MTATRLSPRVMLLIDADNVTADVIEQALHLVKERHGAAHVRRAYCTAELALKQLKLFKTHSIRPIVNVSTGKNSTDIALAVDAMDLVVSERPDVVVVVSSDSDFAPLVIRLREKGCRVEGIGQEGKTGDDSKPVYDDFIDLPHRKARSAPARTAAAPAASPPRRSRAAAPAAVDVDLDLNLAQPPEAPPTVPPPARPSRKRAARGAAKTAAAVVAAPLPEEVQRILAALPELQQGGRVQLNLAKERLCGAGLLAKSAPSTKLFRKFPALFVLSPESAPNKVEFRRPEAP